MHFIDFNTEYIIFIKVINFFDSNLYLYLFIACVPGLYYVGTDNSKNDAQFHVMIMDLLGPSLEDLF